MSNLETIIFKKKSFSGLMEEIYENSKKKEAQISALISELKPLINDIGDATLIVPLIKEYMEVGVKNDEHLIKLAAIVQRSMQNISNSGDSLGISEDEKAQLLAEINKMQSPPKK
jgi:hypothetical protein